MQQLLGSVCEPVLLQMVLVMQYLQRPLILC
jgi:hypothetical protein